MHLSFSLSLNPPINLNIITCDVYKVHSVTVLILKFWCVYSLIQALSDETIFDHDLDCTTPDDGRGDMAFYNVSRYFYLCVEYIKNSFFPCRQLSKRQNQSLKSKEMLMQHTLLLLFSAIIDLNGRYFGGRVVKACFYNLDRFRRLDLSSEVENPT